MKRFLLYGIFFFACFTLTGQDKIPMDHEIYRDWKEIKNPQLSDDGKYLSFEINPQKGDGLIVLRDLKQGSNDTIVRACSARFTFDSEYLVGKIKPPESISRQAKKEKKKAHEMPADSLFIYDLKSRRIDKFPDIESFQLSEEGINRIAFHQVYRNDTSGKDHKKYSPGKSGQKNPEDNFSGLAEKYKLADMVIYNPENGISTRYENVAGYRISKNGRLVAFHQMAADTVPFSVMYTYNTDDEELNICFEDSGIIQDLTVDDKGLLLAFLSSKDTSAVSGVSLNLWETGKDHSRVLIAKDNPHLYSGWGVSKYGKLYFSGNSERLFFGCSPLKNLRQKDSLIAEEKASLDVWSWEDGLLQPMQLKQLEKEKKRTYLCYYSLKDNRMITLADTIVKEVMTMHEGDGDKMIGFAGDHYAKYISWEGFQYRDVYVIDAATGSKELCMNKQSDKVVLSPFGRYILNYNPEDSTWLVCNTQNGSKVNLTADIPYAFYNEDNDEPHPSESYGFAGFTDQDRDVLIYDRYDIWMIDPEGVRLPENLTSFYGRRHKTRLRYIKTDPDDYYIDLSKPLFMKGFTEGIMQDGIYSLRNGDVKIGVTSDDTYPTVLKAGNAQTWLYSKGNFRDYNDLYLTDSEFRKTEKISDANPQSARYLWGEARLEHWISPAGDSLTGILYTPEDIDVERKYPMLVYFYERMSETLNQHKIPSPSKSIINPAWCTSNGYVVFIPDIVYRIGYPGQSAYDAVISGTRAMLDKYDFIDSTRLGLQGQSWGGYQVAWLVTRTPMFAAAMAGAPVSNMTSAYGGIRWGTGMSRMFQYESTQSRIGATLWERPDLYIENSPLFRVPDIHTPLLIMHNDKDGAVPWYQGIEFFAALRRLGKPAWMLSYNHEEHNLTKWPNRMDLDIRMMQFFDHYLKGSSMPSWMKNGVPAIEKNEKNGIVLMEKNKEN